jgi:preprotein translocase subunit YajC
LNFKDINDNTSIVGDTLITVGASKKAIATASSTQPVANKPIIKTENKPVIVTNTNTNINTKTQTDLVARVLTIGHINNNNVFTSGTITPEGNRPAIRFEVINNGDTLSGSWTFKALLPSKTTPIYNSPLQPSLAKGDRVEFTLGFDTVPNGGDVYIFINENRSVKESNYSNNDIIYKLGNNTSNTNTQYLNYQSGKDLVIKLVNTGYIENGQFVPSESILGSQRAGVKFTVTNIGSLATGEWRFQADLPSRTEKTYTSKYMTSLVPGGSIEIIIGFDNIEKVGDNTVYIKADFDNKIPEFNENNNSLTTTIKTRSY